MLVAAREHDLHRHAGRLRKPRGNNHFRGRAEFRSETTAEMLTDHADTVGRQAEAYCKIVARGKNALGRAPDRELVAGRVPARDRAVSFEAYVRLHRRRVSGLDRVGRDLESLRYIADARVRS